LYYPHEKRGKEAMDAGGVLNGKGGVMVHDHWKPYFTYDNKEHALCNAHYLRELTAATEEGQKWPPRMTELLTETNKQTIEGGGKLTEEEQQRVNTPRLCRGKRRQALSTGLALRY